MNEQILPGLYIIASPIGNLSDMTERARFTLQQVDWVAAEDTRETTKLLRHWGISVEVFSLHQYSGPKKIDSVLDRLKLGGAGAYLSDAGTPGVSDPGAELVAAALSAGIRVMPIPGASALTALLSVSGFSRAEAIIFHGFLPREKQEDFWLRAATNSLHVFFESPFRVRESLSVLAKLWPQATIVMGRELTKKFEEVWRGSCAELAQDLAEREENRARGEFVFALFREASTEGEKILERAQEEYLRELVVLGAQQKLLVRVMQEMGFSRKYAYQKALDILGKQSLV